MAEIHAEADAVSATAALLLALADDPNDVAFTHGPNGPMFVVPDALAQRVVSATQKPVELEKEEEQQPAPKAPEPVGAPPVLEEKKAASNPRAKAKE